MSEDTLQVLRIRLNLKQREIDLIQAIDHIRDTAAEPASMLSAIANILNDHFQADLCLLCLLDRETGALELKAINDRSEPFGQLEPLITRELAQRAVEADDVVVWDGANVLPESTLGQLPDDNRSLQLAAVPIIMGKERLGALLIARSQPPFGPDDVTLLKTAESHIDSAVIQGYAYYDLQQRNKELETIYRIDRIRDQHLPFKEMLNGVLQELRAVIQA